MEKMKLIQVHSSEFESKTPHKKGGLTNLFGYLNYTSFLDQQKDEYRKSLVFYECVGNSVFYRRHTGLIPMMTRKSSPHVYCILSLTTSVLLVHVDIRLPYRNMTINFTIVQVRNIFDNLKQEQGHWQDQEHGAGWKNGNEHFYIN